MDTKTPPIPLKPHPSQEKPHPRKVQSSRGHDLSLPPLTPPRERQQSRNQSRNQSRTQLHRNPDVRFQDQGRRPYRVLQLGATPLMHACQQGDRARALRLLAEQRETVGYRDRALRSALHYCMDAGTGGAVAAAAPDLVNAPDAEGHTPLHLAVIAGDTQLVAVLLANGADVNAKDNEGHSVLHWATVCGEAECVRLVLAAGARPSSPDLRGGSPLHYAAQCCGAAATAELAVPKKVAIGVLRTLLEYGADVNARDEDGRQPILWAASAGSVEAVLALARAGGSAAAGASDKDGLTALHCAASRGHARCIETLVNLCGSQPDHVDDNGCSALHYAATLGQAEATALILRLGADPNRRDRKGRTPALCAAAKGQLETLKILAQHGGSLHATTVRGTGVGHEAVGSGRVELIEWLARKRPGVLHVATQDGKTPLHVAALHGQLDACKVLLDHGARINAILRTSKGNSMTPLDAALYRGYRDCAKLLQVHGGVTARNLEMHLQTTAPPRAKASASNVRSGATGSSNESSSESSSRTRSRRDRPVLSYERRSVERRTRRRGSSRRLTRRDSRGSRGSRSFSEEEIRLSKTSSRRDRRRRARSECARYEDDATSDRRLRKKGNRRRTRYRHDRTSSFSGSEGSDRLDLLDPLDRSRHGLGRDGSTGTGSKETEKEKDSDLGTSKRIEDRSENLTLIDDSLELVVVERSFEKKCEKVVSDRKSKTPRESLRETKVTKTHKRTSRRKSKSSSRYKILDGKEEGKEKAEEETEEEEEEAKVETEDGEEVKVSESKGKKREERSRKSVSSAIDGIDCIVRNRYPRDATDSTSQETVERVVVTAMVHTDQRPDTPKSTLPRSEGDEETIRSTRSTKREEEAGESEADKGKKEEGQLASTPTVKESDARAADGAADDAADVGASEDNAKVAKLQDNEDGSKTETAEAPEIQQGSSDTRYAESNEDDARAKTAMSPSARAPVEREEESPRAPSSKGALEADSEKPKEEETIPKAIESPPPKRSETESPEEESEEETQRETTATTSRRHAITVYVKTTEDDSETERRESLEDKDQADSARGKSLDLSSESAREEEDEEEAGDGPIGNKTTPRESSRSLTKEEDFKGGVPRRLKSAKRTGISGRRDSSSKSKFPSKFPSRKSHLVNSEDRSLDRSAIVAVIDDSEEEVAREIEEAIGEDVEPETDQEEDDEVAGVVRVLPSTSEEETPRSRIRSLAPDSLSAARSLRPEEHQLDQGLHQDLHQGRHLVRQRTKQRRDSAGRDSGIEPSPRVSRIPRRKNAKCCPNTTKQQALDLDTITSDVQVSLRRYFLERKIFFQLMELKRLQIRHGRANEHVLVKRQVDAFHKAGMTGPTLGLAKYNQPFTFRHFEAFLYEQLRKLQRRSATPDFCTEAKQCTQRTHRCHHATTAYTSVPIYTYLGGDVSDRGELLLPKIEGRGKGQMTVELTHGEGKQIIALPAEKLDRTKRYFVSFTVRGETRDVEKPDKPDSENHLRKPRKAPRNAKSG